MVRPFLCLVLVLVPVASAGSAAEPEITDPAGDTDLPLPGGDVLAAWIEDADVTGFTTAIRLADFATPRDILTDHYVSFRIDDGHWCTYVYAMPQGGYEVSACGYDADRGLQDGNFRETEGGIEGTAPATIRARFPLDFARIDGTIGYTLTDLRVETFDFKRAGDGPSTWPARRDSAVTETAFVFTSPGAPTPTPTATSEPPQTEQAPAPLAALLLAAVALLAWNSRR